MTDVCIGVSEEVRRLRLLRLLQVREQSKAIAKKVRDRVEEEKYKKVSQTYAERRNQIEKEKRELQRLYELRLSTIGESHNLAAAEEQSKNDWIKESNLKKRQDSVKASERSKTALASFRENKTPNKNFERKNRSTQHESVGKSTGSSNEIDQINESGKAHLASEWKKRHQDSNEVLEKDEEASKFFTTHLKEFDGPASANTPFNRKKSSEIQTHSHDHRKSSIREEHNLAATKENLEKERIKKVGHTIKALERSKAAAILKKRTSTENTSPERRTSRLESARRNISPTDKFDQYYEENEALDNDCRNLSDDTSEITKKRVESHFSMNASPFPVKEGYNKTQYHKLDIVDSPNPLESQLSISDIEKALCECEPRLKSVVTNVHNLLKNNVKYDQITSQDINENIPTSSSEYLIGKPQTEREKKVEFIPITIISDYLKIYDGIASGRIDDNNHDGVLSHDNGSALRKYSESEFSDVRRVEPSTISNDHRNVKNVGFTVDSQKENPRKNPTPKRVISSNSEKVLLKNMHRSKNGRIKSPILCAPSLSNLKYRTPFHNKRIVKCYDYNNKFSKRALVNDDDIVKRLSRKKVDAFQSAVQETLETNVVEKSLEVTKARLNELGRLRGKKALEKMKIEEDYRRLLEELEFLTKKERLISGNRDLKLREKVNNQDERYNQSRTLDDEFDTTMTKLKTDVSTNVAHWDVSSEQASKSKRDHLIDSESSVHSIIVQETKQVNTFVQHQQVVEDMEPAKPPRTKAKEKVASKKTKKSQNIAIGNVNHKNFPVISIKNDSTTDSKESSQIFTASSVQTFEGLEIRIQMKKPKSESIHKKTLETKNKQVQTAVSEFESSSEISIKTSKIETRKEEIIMKKNSSLRFDSSDSTAYMSPPEKWTVNYIKKNRASNGNSKNAVAIENFDKSTNADLGVNKAIADDNCLLETNSREVQITSLNDKSPRISFESSDSSGHLPKEDITTISMGNLESYIKRLLGISETEMKNLNVDVSDVTTPNSSVMNISSNLKPPKCVDNKIDQIQTYIQESYDLLEQFKKANLSSNERIYKIGSQKKVTRKQLENSSNGKTLSSNKPIKNDQKIEAKAKTSDDGCACSNDDKNKAALSTFSRKSIKSNLGNSRKGITDSSNKLSTINIQKFKGKQKIEDKIKPIDDDCACSVENANKAAASMISTKLIQSNPEDSRKGRTDSSKSIINVQKNKDKIKTIDDGCACSVDDENVASASQFTKKSTKSNPEDSQSAKTDSSSEPIINNQKFKGKQKIEDEIKKIDDGCVCSAGNIAAASPLSRKSVASKTEDAPIFDDQENKYYQEKSNSNTLVEVAKNEETLDRLGAEHAKRIQNYSQQLDRLRREKHMPFSSDDTGDSSMENREVLKEIEFIPLLSDIPKPNSQNNILDFDRQKINIIKENPSPFYELNPNLTPNKDLFSNYPHNLSTIMEVDTPVTNKNSSTLIKNIDMDIEALHQTLVNISDERTDNEVSSIFEPNTNRSMRPPLLEYTNDVNVEPFVSLSRFVQSKPDRKIVLDEFGCNSSSEESISGLSELIATNKSLLKKTQPDKQVKNWEMSGVCRMDSSSGSSTPELNKLIKSFGPESMATWKKTEECQALSSSASSSSTWLDITKNDILSKLIDVTVTTVGLSTLHDDLDLSEDRQSQFNVLTNSLLKQKLDLLLKNMGKKGDPKKRAAEEVAIVMNLIKDKDSAKNTPDRSQGAESTEFQGKDQTQQRTSTPMHPSKMSSTLKSGSQNSSKTTSHYRFSIDSDLSSVKKASSSLSSEDHLTIPNVSLKFNKLFDNDSSMQSDK